MKEHAPIKNPGNIKNKLLSRIAFKIASIDICKPPFSYYTRMSILLTLTVLWFLLSPTLTSAIIAYVFVIIEHLIAIFWVLIGGLYGDISKEYIPSKDVIVQGGINSLSYARARLLILLILDLVAFTIMGALIFAKLS